MLHTDETTLENLAFSVDFLGKVADGARCKLTLRDWRFHLSEKRDGKPEISWTTWNRSMASAGKIVGGESFTFVWKVNGKIGELRGLEKLRQKLESAAKTQKNTDLASASDNRFTAIYWQNFLEKLAEGANAQRLQVGNQWQFTRPADALSFQPLTVSRTATKVSANAATLRDVAVFNVDTTPQKSQNFRDTAIRLEAGLAPKLELRIGRNDAMARPRHDLWRLEARRTFVAFRHANDFA